MPVTAPASQCESPCLMVICGAYTQFCVAAGFEIAARHHTIMRSIARLVSIRRVDWTSSSRLMITAQLMQPSLTDAHVAQIITACSLWDFDAPSHLEILFQLLVDQVLSTMSRANQWFVLADGIVREVITADITRYLGNDASVRPGMGTGEHEGRRGYWITAYRTLTSAMIDDLQADSRRWEQERRSSSSRNAYQDSRTHADRLHTGPSPSATYPPAAPYDRQPALSGSYVYGSRAGFGKYRDSYSSATVDYGGSQFDYPFVPSAVDPRTTLGPFGSQSSQPPVAFYSTPAPTPTRSAQNSTFMKLFDKAQFSSRLLHCF